MVGWVGYQPGWRWYETDFVRLEIPAGMNCGPVGPPPELTAMTLCRGEFAPGSPASIILATREQAEPGRRTWEDRVEEGLALDYVERLDLVVFERGRDFASVTVRTIAAHDHGDAIERIIDSIHVLPSPH